MVMAATSKLPNEWVSMIFGSELALSWECLICAQEVADLSLPTNDASLSPPLRRILVQPAFEGVEWLFQSQWMSHSWTITDLETLATLLCGQQIQVRTEAASITRLNEEIVHFEAGDNLTESLDTIIDQMNKAEDLNELEVARIGSSFLILHPFTDCNGRITRAILRGLLSKHVSLRDAFLPLGPYFYVNRDLIFRTAKVSKSSCDSAALSDCLHRIIRFARTHLRAIDRVVEPSCEDIWHDLLA
jgi:Fic/DOC family